MSSSQGSRNNSNRGSLTAESMADQVATSSSFKPITPEPRPDHHHHHQTVAGQTNSPSTPGPMSPFDWDEFQDRYEQALEEADANELAILEEFNALSRYFNVWAGTSSAHDNERAAKRLQTRQRFVALAEERVVQKQRRYGEVLRAFQNALALLKTD